MATNFENYELETNNKSLVGGINELHSSATALSARVKVVEDLVGTGETGETLVGRVTELETLVGTGFGETAITEKVSQVESKLDALNTVVTAETTGLTAKVGALETESTRVKGVLGDATNDDLSKLHDLSASAEELNYMVGVTVNVQTQLDAKVSNDTYTGYTAATKTALDAKLTAVTVDSGLSVTNTVATAPKISLKLAADGGLVLDAEGLSVDSTAYATKDSVDTLSESVANKQDKAFTGHSSFTATTVEGALDELKAQVVAAETVVITGWRGLESALGESTSAGTEFVSGTTPENMYASLTGAVTASKDILIKVGASGTAKVLFANVASDTVTMHCLVNNRLAYITVTASEFGVSFLQFA